MYLHHPVIIKQSRSHCLCDQVKNLSVCLSKLLTIIHAAILSIEQPLTLLSTLAPLDRSAGQRKYIRTRRLQSFPMLSTEVQLYV